MEVEDLGGQKMAKIKMESIVEHLGVQLQGAMKDGVAQGNETPPLASDPKFYTG